MVFLPTPPPCRVARIQSLAVFISLAVWMINEKTESLSVNLYVIERKI